MIPLLVSIMEFATALADALVILALQEIIVDLVL